MGLQITQVRVKNFRSLESLDVKLTQSNVVLGQNNCGKSNLLRAINIALTPNPTVSEEDIFVAHGESLTKDKASIIDILIRPTNEDGSVASNFSAFWAKVFTTNWIATDIDTGDFVGIRTIIAYNPEFDSYRITRKQIKVWEDSIESAKCSKNIHFNADMQSYIFSFYMDAQRDIIDDIKNQKSYFGRATSSKDMPQDLVREIEDKLDAINEQIVANTPALRSAEARIAQIGNVVGGNGGHLQIEPISRKISDLHRGIDVKFRDGTGASFSLADHGMGTRSWVSFLTLGAYVNYLSQCIREKNPEAEIFVVLTLEEPEAHLHAAAQKKLYAQIKDFQGQKIVSTHSPCIVAQADVAEFIHLYKQEGKTSCNRLDKERYEVEELAKIQREFINSKGDLLFSTAIILAEGITEEQALPIYFEKYFGTDPSFSGVSILGIGGQNYHTFIKLVNDFKIPWFIFSDGEAKTIATVRKAVLRATGQDIENVRNVIIIDQGNDYERHLISSGYTSAMIQAIDKYEKVLREEIDPEGAQRDPRGYFERYVEENNHKPAGTKKSDQVCENCGRPLSEQVFNDYDGDEGVQRALLDVCQRGKNKAKYASQIAQEIVSSDDPERVVPPKVKELFVEVNSLLQLHQEV